MTEPQTLASGGRSSDASASNQAKHTSARSLVSFTTLSERADQMPIPEPKTAAPPLSELHPLDDIIPLQRRVRALEILLTHVAERLYALERTAERFAVGAKP